MSDELTQIPALRAAVARAVRYKNPGAETAARRELAEAKIAAYVQKALEAAPPLTDEQRIRLAELLRPNHAPPNRRTVIADRLSELDGGAA